MANTVAIISVVSGATVAIVVPWITATLERRRLRQQVAESRIDELRTVLDEAAIALARCFSALPTWDVVGQAVEQGADTASVLAESRKAVEDTGAQAERIAVRLGESSLVFAGYEQARAALWKLYHGLAAEDALHKIPEFEFEERTNPEQNQQFSDGRRAFREGARQIVGPEVAVLNRGWGGRFRWRNGSELSSPARR
jgi:hypothetical protein